MPSKNDEQVLCVASKHLWWLPPGLTTKTEDIQRFLHTLTDNFREYVPRGHAETCEAYRQVIPYTVIDRTGVAEPTYFSYVRGGGSGEKRLQQLRSIGIGGHIVKEDEQVDARHPWHAALKREVLEEVALEVVRMHPYVVGLIRDDSSPVGRVHVGLVYRWLAGSQDIRPAEESVITDVKFLTLGQLRSEPALETWTQLIVNDESLL